MHETLACQLGVVVIGRNEGSRLIKCFDAIQGKVKTIVYVDSGSVDDSIDRSKALGINTLELDVTIPFTAARARNEGFRRLTQIKPELTYVQFIDGDCEMVDGWLHNAIISLEQNKNVAVVCGRRRERFPEKTIYNLLCDIEWDTPVGEASACGGDALFRVNAFEQIGGFNQDLIAGEEPELCFRLRARGWKIWRLDSEMVLHDAAITQFRQWWKRSMRTGYAYANGAFLHGKSAERPWARESRSAWIWGFLIPISIALTYSALGFWAMFMLIVYPIQITRIALRGHRTIGENWIYACFVVTGKFPEFLGQIKFQTHRIFQSRVSLIEYK